MKILGIETATDICAAAVCDGSRVVSERVLEGRQRHSEKLLRLVDEALAEASLTVAGLGAVAVSIGPGSFTGLRIGLSAAKGIAYAAGIPIVAVPTLEALAAHAFSLGAAGEGDLVAPVIAARRGEFYMALYDVHEGGCRTVREAADGDAAALAAHIPEGRRTILCGSGAAQFWTSAGQPGRLAVASSVLCSAAAVALAGGRRLAAGGAADLASLEPLYIKEFFSTAHT